MKKNLTILGSTGSIGRQTIQAAKAAGSSVCALTANKNVDLLIKQAVLLNPDIAVIADEKKYKKLKAGLEGTKTKPLAGIEGLLKAASYEKSDMVVAAISGISGLVPTYEAIKKGKTIALANKEVLVSAGKIIIEEAEKTGSRIIPIDSEHSAVFQCLKGNRKKDIKKIILTASGGPFRNFTKEQLKNVTLKMALNHPTWKMGKKVTIDSATMMNKGLEVIEARWLFDLKGSKIDVIIHPQSIIHSMVEYNDGNVISQMGAPDMRLAIQYAMTYPKRMKNNFKRLDLVKAGSLTFEEPDYNKFLCLKLAYEALKEENTMPAVMNAANETAVNMFLEGKISFNDIPYLINKVMESHNMYKTDNINDIIEIDKQSGIKAVELGGKI